MEISDERVGKKVRKVSIKLVFLGASQVGKSSIVLRFVRGKFYEFNESTVGAAFLQQEVPLRDNIMVKFDIWDTAGQERFNSITGMYYRNAPAAMVCYDVTCADSFQRAKQWIRELRIYGRPSVQIALIGNKCDLNNQRKVPHELAKDFAEDQKILFFETSAKTGKNINECFVGIASRLDIDDLLQEEEDTTTKSFLDLDNTEEKEVVGGSRCFC